jgi:hypothetical protein
MQGEGGGGCGVSANEYSCTQEPQMSFGDLAPYLTYATLQGKPLLEKYSRIRVMLVHGLKLCLQRVHSAVGYSRFARPGKYIRTGLASSHVSRKRYKVFKYSLKKVSLKVV